MLSPAGDLTRVFSEFELERSPAIAAAVSGGSDSTALLLLIKAYLDRVSPATRLVAVTVDHCLRSESAEEAGAVGRLAAGLRIDHRILRWDDPKPGLGIIAAARHARYRLLKQAAIEIGANVILAAHTADDQAETVLMRQHRGDGLGLAGMASATLFDGTHWLLRPLLSVRRKTLRDFLSGKGVTWFDDPTNTNFKYERARIRSQLNATPAAVTELLALSSDKAIERIALGTGAADLLSKHARLRAPGLLHLDAEFRFAGGDAAIHALRHLLAVTGGVEHLPDHARVAALVARKDPYRTTLSRSVIASRRDGIWLCREQRGLPQLMTVRDQIAWDGRFRIFGSSVPVGSMIVPYGRQAAEQTEIDPRLPPSLTRLALASMPAFQNDNEAGLLNAPVPVLAPFHRFLPSFDVALARALAGLVGAPAPPDPPWAGHIVTRA